MERVVAGGGGCVGAAIPLLCCAARSLGEIEGFAFWASAGAIAPSSAMATHEHASQPKAGCLGAPYENPGLPDRKKTMEA